MARPFRIERPGGRYDVAAPERVKGCQYGEFGQQHGDWGRDAALWLARRHGRYTLGELGELAGGHGYAAVGQAVSGFNKRLRKPGELARQLKKLRQQVSNVEM